MSTENLPDLQPRSTITTIPYLGSFRIVGDLDLKEMMFLFFAFISVVGTSIIVIVRIVDTSKKGNNDPELTFAILLLINLVFILYYIVQGVFCERSFELIVSVVATIVVMVYCIIEFIIKGKKDQGEIYELKLGRLIAVCVLGPIDVILGCVISYKFFVSRNLIYRTVGGNSALQELCQRMFIFTAFLKFDFQIVISLLVLTFRNHDVSIEKKLVVIGLGIPYSFFWVILAFIMIRREEKRLAYTFWLLSLAEPAYIIYLLVKSGRYLASKKELKNGFLTTNTLNYCIIIAGVIGLVVRVIILGLSLLVVRNFGKGLKEKVYSGRTDQIIRTTPNYESTSEIQ